MQSKRGKKREINFFPSKNPKGQVTIFIIIAIIIIGAIALFLFFKQGIGIRNIPASIQPVYNSFVSCMEDRANTGIDILESQGGYISLPEFEPGNSYMPFSSQLDFLGNPIPYWYYVSGNNLQKEQVPSKEDMEKSLASFIDDGIANCNFENYYSEGFEINEGTSLTSVSIKNSNVDVRINMNMQIIKGQDTAVIGTHNIAVKSSLGTLYNSAKNVYAKEQKELFLENYGIDSMRLYAPVDGVEITCSPKTWDAEKIFSDLHDAIETNTLALKTQPPSAKNEKYFFVSGVGDNVRFINSRSWSSSFEVLPASDNSLIANPVGNQQGLGIIGFCYVPYHFVYNIKYPVLVQVYNGNEVFQFPLAVIIQGNKPRTALNSTAIAGVSDLCNYKNTPVSVRVHDTDLNSVDSIISYECFGESCDIGKTSSGILTADFPQCINGNIVAKADGFKEARYTYSTTSGGSADIILDKLYSLNVNLKLNGANYNGNAMIYFSSDTDSKVVNYPQQKKVNLAEGNYEISAYIYKDSSIQFPATTSQQCTQIPSSGLAGFFGLKQKNCFDVNIPSQLISNVLAGGGKQEYYILENELKNSNAIEINAKGFSTPTTMEELQNNYLLFDSSILEVNFA